MDNKIILFSNLKGGVGKSCLSVLFSTYLHEQGIPVMVVDADIQQSIFRHRQRELAEKPDSALPWQLQPFNSDELETVKSVIDSLKQIPACIVVDCPGNINDRALGMFFQAADVAVTPVRYDSDNLDATQIFAEVFKSVSKARMFFIPNSIAAVEERRIEVQEARESAKDLLEPYGMLTPRIKQSVVVKCYSTILPLTTYQRNAVKFAFEPIIEYIKK